MRSCCTARISTELASTGQNCNTSSLKSKTGTNGLSTQVPSLTDFAVCRMCSKATSQERLPTLPNFKRTSTNIQDTLQKKRGTQIKNKKPLQISSVYASSTWNNLPIIRSLSETLNLEPQCTHRLTHALCTAYPAVSRDNPLRRHLTVTSLPGIKLTRTNINHKRPVPCKVALPLRSLQDQNWRPYTR